MNEVAEVLLERPYYARRTRNNAVMVLGRTCSGRYLAVVAADHDGRAFVITARDMSDQEKRVFKRKAR